MPHDICQLNYLAIAASAVAVWIVAGIWWSNALFGKAWMKATGLTRREMKNGAAGRHILWLAMQLLTAFVLAILLREVGAKDVSGAMCVAFWLWAGLAVPLLVSGVLWAKLAFKAAMIQACFLLISYAVIVLILTCWVCKAA